MTTGRRKHHHTHETSDAYADGWDARLKWRPGTPRPANPYAPADGALVRKQQSEGRQLAQQREIGQWDRGWIDCDEDCRKGDLPEVVEGDFKRAPLAVEDFAGEGTEAEESEEDDLD